MNLYLDGNNSSPTWLSEVSRKVVAGDDYSNFLQGAGNVAAFAGLNVLSSLPEHLPEAARVPADLRFKGKYQLARGVVGCLTNSNVSREDRDQEIFKTLNSACGAAQEKVNASQNKALACLENKLKAKRLRLAVLEKRANKLVGENKAQHLDNVTILKEKTEILFHLKENEIKQKTQLETDFLHDLQKQTARRMQSPQAPDFVDKCKQSAINVGFTAAIGMFSLIASDKVKNFLLSKKMSVMKAAAGGIVIGAITASTLETLTNTSATAGNARSKIQDMLNSSSASTRVANHIDENKKRWKNALVTNIVGAIAESRFKLGKIGIEACSSLGEAVMGTVNKVYSSRSDIRKEALQAMEEKIALMIEELDPESDEFLQELTAIIDAVEKALQDGCDEELAGLFEAEEEEDSDEEEEEFTPPIRVQAIPLEMVGRKEPTRIEHRTIRQEQYFNHRVQRSYQRSYSWAAPERQPAPAARAWNPRNSGTHPAPARLRAPIRPRLPVQQRVTTPPMRAPTIRIL